MRSLVLASIWSLGFVPVAAVAAAQDTFRRPPRLDPPSASAPPAWAGAFTAVADDGSAAFWNPAGLASGAFFGLVIDRTPTSLDRTVGRLIALGDPAARALLLPDRYRRGRSGRSMASSPTMPGVTLVQSLGGSAWRSGRRSKLVHGSRPAATAFRPTSSTPTSASWRPDRWDSSGCRCATSSSRSSRRLAGAFGSTGGSAAGWR